MKVDRKFVRKNNHGLFLIKKTRVAIVSVAFKINGSNILKYTTVA